MLEDFRTKKESKSKVKMSQDEPTTDEPTSDEQLVCLLHAAVSAACLLDKEAAIKGKEWSDKKLPATTSIPLKPKAKSELASPRHRRWRRNSLSGW